MIDAVTVVTLCYRRAQAMDSGLKKAIEVPLTLMRLAHKCWPHMTTLAEHGNITTLSDLKVNYPAIYLIFSL